MALCEIIVFQFYGNGDSQQLAQGIPTFDVVERDGVYTYIGLCIPGVLNVA
jgi:hypothetical protein